MPDSDRPATDENAQSDLDRELLALDPEFAALIADTPADEMADPIDMDALHRLRKLKKTQRLHKRAATGLGPAIEALESAVIANVAPHTSSTGNWSTTVGDDTAYLQNTIWPKRLIDETTGQEFETDTLAQALASDEDSAHLVDVTVNGQRLAAWVRERIEAWRGLRGEDGRRNADGELIDADGHPLDEAEREDPVADVLALPRAVRRVIEVSVVPHVQFRAR